MTQPYTLQAGLTLQPDGLVISRGFVRPEKAGAPALG